MSLGVWISMKSFSTHHVRSACRKVVCTRKMRFCWGGRPGVGAVLLGAARVREGPAGALAGRGVVGPGGLGGGRGDLDVADLRLEAAELDALVVLELARHGEEGAVVQRGDLRGEGVA